MKKLVLLATAAAVLVSVPAVGSAANIKSILNRSQTVTYQGVKLPEGVAVYQNNPKALFAGDAKKDVKSVLVEAGATSADVYTLNIKNENVFELNIIQIIENYNNPVLVILEKENIDKYYETLKKIFGGRNNIPTQFVDLDTIKKCDPKIDNKRGKESIFLNIQDAISFRS